MDDLERRLSEALAGLPGPGEEETARAQRLALDALPAPRRRRSRLLVAAAILVAGAGGAALGAVGGIVRDRETSPGAAASAPPTGVLRLPQGVDGLAVLAGGRVWSRTRTGLAVEGLGASAVEISPNALFLAAGVGHALLALTPAGTRVWSHPAAGPVVAAAWAPNPNPIHVAYVVRTGGGRELRLIEGDGDHDRLLATGVSADRPAWRADALAIWFRRADGAPAGYDLAAGRTLAAADVPRGALARETTGDAPRVAARVRPGWRVRAASAAPGGVVVAVSPAGRAGAGPLEVWSAPRNGAATLVLRVRAPLRGPVTLSVR
jgi:hypothetical protein